MTRLDQKRRPTNYLSRRHQWRLLAMVLGMGLVIMALGELRRPETIARLDQVFAPAQPTQTSDLVSDAQIGRILDRTDDSLPEGTFRAGSSSADDPAGDVLFPSMQPALLTTIRDNSSFRSAETAAWFHLWQLLQLSTSAELIAASRGEVDLAQMIEQPKTYRGQVVTVRGTVHRVEEVTPAKNDFGLERLYLLTIRPPGGQIWPVRAYTLDLPPSFPRGDDVHAEVQVTGFFFKNWSYEWPGGMGLAPVLMAKSVDWLEPRTASVNGEQKLPSLTAVVLGAVTLALAILGYLRWNLRTPASQVPSGSEGDVVRAMQRAVEERRA